MRRSSIQAKRHVIAKPVVPQVQQDREEIGRLPRHIMYPIFLLAGTAMWAGIAYLWLA